jgi:cytochrome b involved in lipid metabolism
VLTPSEVAKHASAATCWIIINGKVYDLTTHANDHSGGAQEILSSCGKDGSVVFNTKGGEGRHSASSSNFLENFYIGDLNGPKVK